MLIGPHGMPMPGEIEDPYDGDADDRYVQRIQQQPLELRRWDGASTHRLNKAQFSDTTGRTINEDLVSNLRSLLDRCAYVATTNPTIEGMIDTNCIDIIGPDGPSLQVLPRRPIGMTDKQMEAFHSYCVEAEELLEDWAEFADYNEEMSFCDILELDINAWWTTGNSYVQELQSSEDSRKGVGTVRLHPVHAERILHQYTHHTSDGGRIVLGCQRDNYGKPKTYYVQEPNEFGSFSGSTNFMEVPAGAMIHDFKRKEPGQFAGVPLLASSLPAIGDEAQFSKLTIEAAKIAATQGIIFEDKFTDSPTVKGKANGGSYKTKLGAALLTHAPKGTEAKQIDPKHPSSTYTDFKNEQWRTIGRPSQMPLMISRLNASNLSYAAARIEAQLYQRAVRRNQSRLRRKYTPTLMSVLREAELARLIPMRPVGITIGASWQGLSHVDPAKHSKSVETNLRSLSSTLIEHRIR